MIRFFFTDVWSHVTERISSNDDPVKKHRYDGTIGKTHGDKKLSRPAKKQTIKNKSIATNIHYYLTYQIKLDTKE